MTVIKDGKMKSEFVKSIEIGINKSESLERNRNEILDLLHDLSLAVKEKTGNMVDVYKSATNTGYLVSLVSKCSDPKYLFTYKYLSESTYPICLSDFQNVSLEAKDIGEVKGFILHLLSTTEVGNFLRYSKERQKSLFSWKIG